MTELTLFDVQRDPDELCRVCRDAPAVADSLCLDCDNVRLRMAELDQLIKFDPAIRRAWQRFRELSIDATRKGATRLCSMPMLYRARTDGTTVSNSLAPLFARKFNRETGRKIYVENRLKRS